MANHVATAWRKLTRFTHEPELTDRLFDIARRMGWRYNHKVWILDHPSLHTVRNKACIGLKIMVRRQAFEALFGNQLEYDAAICTADWQNPVVQAKVELELECQAWLKKSLPPLDCCYVDFYTQREFQSVKQSGLYLLATAKEPRDEPAFSGGHKMTRTRTRPTVSSE